ncbi:hypothetical protein SERLA73DRAFT_136105 [Serpula lacrymans var. lacrymans S7.3]|uniref:Uncharacterized protein n=1 Tax=Serpula lacrymans var. lacrymans (strain S7.3) TaxID=936435 RepID=F8PWJ3_SERL3|nr:hypothetical protein SERLA73DRAFT_136105 [Serpula lacrymans var. lacrymans S7.3]
MKCVTYADTLHSLGILRALVQERSGVLEWCLETPNRYRKGMAESRLYWLIKEGEDRFGINKVEPEGLTLPISTILFLGAIRGHSRTA